MSAIEQSPLTHPNLTTLVKYRDFIRQESTRVYPGLLASRTPVGVSLGVGTLGVGDMGKLSAVMVRALRFPADKARPSEEDRFSLRRQDVGQRPYFAPIIAA